MGSIFRTADGAGVTKVFLSGYTPAPIDRFGRTVHEIQKTSLGATESVAWEVCEDTMIVIDRLKKSGVRIIAVEQHERAVPYFENDVTDDTAFIFGNEIEGVPNEVCEEADMVVHIPMKGTKESLNVSVATGIVLFDAQMRADESMC